MIVSHEHRFIFVKTHKTGGTSVEIALAEHCGPDDIITPIVEEDEAYRTELGFRGPQHTADTAGVGHHHARRNGRVLPPHARIGYPARGR